MENENQKMLRDLFVFLQGIWGKRFFIIKSICVGLFLGILIAFSIPKQFQADVKFLINDDLIAKREQGMSVATLMGLNIKDICAVEIPKDMYPEFVKSTNVLSKLATRRVRLQEGQEISLFDYVINYQKEPWWNKILNLPATVKKWFADSDKVVVSDAEWNDHSLSLTQQHFINYLRGNIQVETDKNKAIGYVRVTAQNTVVAAEIANFVTQSLEKRITEIRHEKLERELLLAQKMYENSEHEYQMMLERYETRVLKNKVEGYSPVKLDIAFNLYNMLARQYEIMKVNADLPGKALEILQPAVASDIAISPHKKKIIIGLMFLLGCLSILWCLFKQAWEIDYKK